MSLLKMKYQEYHSAVKNIRVGKQLPDAIYLHQEALILVPEPLTTFLQQVIDSLKLNNDLWNIVKFYRRDFKLSLLDYPDFFANSYPALHCSYTINLVNLTYRKTNYSKSTNPPILHRKETFLQPDHPRIQQYAKITKEGEVAGLYREKKRIGFRKNWEQIIEQQGYEIVNGRLLKRRNSKMIDGTTELQVNSPDKKRIERHKTAIDRNSLSVPMQSLFRHDYFNGTYSLFDYGCGKGDDLNILASHKIIAAGWDPIYYPTNKVKTADIVNLGFVLNVIEKPSERKETAVRAYKLARKLLVASVMLGVNR